MITVPILMGSELYGHTHAHTHTHTHPRTFTLKGH